MRLDVVPWLFPIKKGRRQSDIGICWVPGSNKGPPKVITTAAFHLSVGKITIPVFIQWLPRPLPPKYVQKVE